MPCKPAKSGIAALGMGEILSYFLAPRIGNESICGYTIVKYRESFTTAICHASAMKGRYKRVCYEILVNC
jgi:hypothetical protein